MTGRLMIPWLLVLLVAASPLSAQTPLGTAITYQGQLKDDGSPASGDFNMAFRLYDDPAAGNQVGPTVTMPAVPVVDGLFTAALDFGPDAYLGDQLWLEVTVSGTPLSPRQKLTAAPYARYAAGPWTANGVDLWYSDGNVGIGTDAPSASLSLGGSVTDTKLALWDAGPGQMMGLGIGSGQFRLHLAQSTNRFSFLSDDVAGTELMTIRGSGNVGIGTDSPGAKLDVRGSGIVNVFAGNQAPIGVAGFETNFLLPQTHAWFVEDGERVFSVAAGGNAYVAGQVGIGTTSPGKKLSIGSVGTPDSEGMIRLSSRSGDGLSSRAWDIGVPETNEDPSDIGYSFVIDDVLAGTEPEFIVKYGSGNVGIGTVAPSSMLSVAGGADFAGNVGIGTTAPGRKLSVGDIDTNDSEGMIRLSSRSGSGGASREWDIGVPETEDITSGSGYSFVIDDILLGSAPEFMIEWGTGNVGIGTTSPAAKLDVAGVTRTQVIQITGGADIAEPFNVNAGSSASGSKDATNSIEPGMVVCIDPQRTGELVLSHRPYDRTVAGIISGAGGVNPGMTLQQTGSVADGQHPVALTGRAYCYVDAGAGGAVRPGDLLTTSSTSGHAMRVNDYAAAHGAVIGKAMSSLDSGKGLVLVLVNLQ